MSIEPGRPNEKRSNEVNTTSTAVAAEEEVESVRQGVAGQGRKNARIPPRFLPGVLEPCCENRGHQGGMGLEERR